MPTTAERLDSDLDALNVTLKGCFPSWTDDLPVCHRSGVGIATNQVYQTDGVCKEEHEFEDRSFRFCLDADTSFYGVFDGHFGCGAVEFASQRMPAEILLGQLKDKENDSEIKEVLRQAFLTVEASFFQTIDGLLAEKEDLKLQLQGVDPLDAVKQYPTNVQRLNSITAEIESGTAAVVALVHRNKLYVANAGNCRAVMCKVDESGKNKIFQLSVDHNFENEDELLRLSQLGLNYEELRQQSTNRRHQCTRCLGNYVVKGGYKEFHNLSDACEEPIIADPEVIGGIQLDSTCSFLILMSSGLYKSLEDASNTSDGNTRIAEMLNEQFLKHSALNDAAQAVVDNVVNIHYEAFMKNKCVSKNCQKLNDMTLLVINFNKFVPKDSNTTTSSYWHSKGKHVTFPKAPVMYSSKAVCDKSVLSSIPGVVCSINNTLAPTKSVNSDPSNSKILVDSTGNHTTSSAQETSFSDEGRITPYVDFSDFYSAVEEAYHKGEVPEDWTKQFTREREENLTGHASN